MRLPNLLHMYRVRVRARLLQEGFALAGITAGVALLCASQITSQSLSSSVTQLSHGIAGRASLQLIARDPRGFDARLLSEVRRIAGVRTAAPLLEASANVVGPRGSRSAELIGADETLARLGGTLVRHTRLAPFGGIAAIVLPAPLARSIGVTRFGSEATLQLGGNVSRAPLFAQLSARQIGPLIDTPIVVAPLSYAQEAAGLASRLTRILIAPAPGHEARVRAALVRLSQGRLNVEPVSYDEALFAKAATASNQSTVLFAVISALVGFLFAFNAMLLSVPERRRLVAMLRRDGYTPGAVLGVLVLDACVLGAAGSALGLVLGDELSLRLFHSAPGFLSSAFTVGEARVVSARSLGIAAAGGMLASLVAVLSPLRDIVSRDPLAAISLTADVGGEGRRRLLVAIGAACLMLAVTVLLFAPQLAILGMVSLLCALLLELPLALAAALGVVARLARAFTSAVAHLATMELRAGRTRALAVAATGAVAVFGSVSIQGAHGDLEHGLDNAARDMNAFTNLWVSPAGSFNLLMTQPFAPRSRERIARIAGVKAVRLYRGGLLDWNERRVWVIGPPPQATPLIPPSQLLQGSRRDAVSRLRGGGWAVLSQALADEHHLRIGDAFTLPSPLPRRLRLAAISTNIGWAPGAILLNASDFARAWGSEQPSAYNVLLTSGASTGAVAHQIKQVLGASSGLAVQSAEEHADKQRTLTREGLARLSQIATLILVAAALAMAAAMGALIWQRRPRLAKLKLEGISQPELWATLVLESLLLLGVGCFAGAVFGLLGQQLLDRALSETVNYPVVASLALGSAAWNLLVVSGVAGAILIVAGYFAASVPAELALQEP
ncbi:MAG: hypothetical protein H0X28_08765 [Solirubrobacterales bacterium]|nr:hypothetical protein [Solirubrobacterales bacterium]